MPSIEFVFPGQDKSVKLSMMEGAKLCEDPKKLGEFVKSNMKGKENASKPSKMDRSDSK